MLDERQSWKHLKQEIVVWEGELGGLAILMYNMCTYIFVFYFWVLVLFVTENSNFCTCK